MKPSVVLVLGDPGAGNGTRAPEASINIDYTHLSAGELDERKNPDSQYVELIQKYIKDGRTVPAELTIHLLKQKMDQTRAVSAQKNQVLIDGFPGNQDNRQGWNKTIDEKAEVALVLFLMVIMRSVLNHVLRGERAVVGVKTTQMAWKREFKSISSQQSQLLT